MRSPGREIPGRQGGRHSCMDEQEWVLLPFPDCSGFHRRFPLTVPGGQASPSSLPLPTQAVIPHDGFGTSNTREGRKVTRHGPTSERRFPKAEWRAEHHPFGTTSLASAEQVSSMPSTLSQPMQLDSWIGTRLLIVYSILGREIHWNLGINL